MAKVIIVDDSRSIIQQVRFTLERAGHELVTAADGEEGIEVIAGNQDAILIISDVNMARKDGLEMVEDLKKSGNTIPIIMLTTEGKSGLIRRAKAAGCKGWLVKPFTPTDLINAVERFCA